MHDRLHIKETQSIQLISTDLCKDRYRIVEKVNNNYNDSDIKYNDQNTWWMEI